MEINQITVIGAGEMGHGIAELASLSGFKVVLRDVSEEIVKDAFQKIKWSLDRLLKKEYIESDDVEKALERITLTCDLEESVEGADFVIEAVPEKMGLKKELFEEVDVEAPERAILASNTSSLSITEIGSSTQRPDKVVGMHFANPPILLDFVEVIRGEETSDSTVEVTMELVEKLGKTPILCKKDVPRFIMNNIVAPYCKEAQWMKSRGEASIEEIDSAFKYKEGFPMGPFELSDHNGLDVDYHICEQLGEKVPPILEERVEKGEYGKKTGKGFYDYEEGEGADYDKEAGEKFDTLPIMACMANEAAKLIQNEVTTADQIDKTMSLVNWPEGVPCRRADEIGIGKIVKTLDRLKSKHGEERYEPADLLREMVSEGKKGRKTGEGFYKYN